MVKFAVYHFSLYMGPLGNTISGGSRKFYHHQNEGKYYLKYNLKTRVSLFNVSFGILVEDLGCISCDSI